MVCVYVRVPLSVVQADGAGERDRERKCMCVCVYVCMCVCENISKSLKLMVREIKR